MVIFFLSIFLASVIGVVIVMNLILMGAEKQEKKMSPEKIVVTHPKSYFAVGLLVAIFFDGMLIAMAVMVEDMGEIWWVAIILSLFAFLGIYILIKAVRFKIRVEEEYLEYTDTFKKSVRVGYGEIAKVVVLGPDSMHMTDRIQIYFSEKNKIKVEKIDIGYDLLLRKLKDEGVHINTYAPFRA